MADYQGLEREYRQSWPLLDGFGKELSNQIGKLLQESEVTLGFPVHYRIKTWESIAEKLERLPRFKSVKELQDLVGLRIILLFRRDLSQVCKVLQQHFTVDRQYDTLGRLREDQFGYSSIHFVIRLHKEWLSVPTFAGADGLVAEIQVRTLAQHIWAEASHKLQYKHEDNVPPTVRRAIHRVSALLETVDLEFERVLEQREEYRSQINQPPKNNDDDLNVDLLEATLDSLLPHENKSENEDYSQLLHDLAHFGVTTRRQLEELCSKHARSILDQDAQKVRVTLGTTAPISDYLRRRAQSGVYYAHMGIVREALRKEFPAEATTHYLETKPRP
jgi:ppGpp synthetase/RelA/SpoT-type nucleotidyltranferase